MKKCLAYRPESDSHTSQQHWTDIKYICLQVGKVFNDNFSIFVDKNYDIYVIYIYYYN